MQHIDDAPFAPAQCSGPQKAPEARSQRRVLLDELRRGLKVGEPFRPFFKGQFLFNGCSIPEEILGLRCLSEGAKLCYARLTRYQGTGGEARPSYERLGRDLGVSARQARRYIGELENLRFISHTNRKNGLRRGNNVYEFLWHHVFTRTDLSNLNRTEMAQLLTKMSNEDSHHQDFSSMNDTQVFRRSVRKPPARAFKGVHPEHATDLFGIDRCKLDFLVTLKQRHGEATAEICLQKVLEGLHNLSDLPSIVEFDNHQTTAPKKLRNPAGYYVTLTRKFYLRRNRDRKIHTGYGQEGISRSERNPCPESRCDGSGQVYNSNAR